MSWHCEGQGAGRVEGATVKEWEPYEGQVRSGCMARVSWLASFCLRIKRSGGSQATGAEAGLTEGQQDASLDIASDTHAESHLASDGSHSNYFSGRSSL